MTTLKRRASSAIATLVLLITASSSAAQSAPKSHVRGSVLDASTGKPVANASVRVLGSSAVATTGADGRFEISNAPTGVFNIEATLATRGSGVADNVVLRAGAESDVTIRISRTALLGGGLITSTSLVPFSARKSPFAVEKISADEMPVPAAYSAIASLEGKVAGLDMQRANGSPGADLSLQLRTPVTLRDTATITPLLIIDGVMMSQYYPLSAQDIEALDVANIEVIKGVAASTLYGMRGINGVITVTTKRGRGVPAGKLEFSLRNEIGINNATNLFDPLPVHQYRVNASGQYINAQGTVVSRENRVLSATGFIENRYIVPVYDEDDAFFQNSLFNTQTLTLKQNRPSNNFSLGYSRTQQQTTVRDADGLQRHTLRFNADQRIGSRISMGFSGSRVEGREKPIVASLSTLNPDVDLLATEPSGVSPYILRPDTLTGNINPLVVQALTVSNIRRQRTLLNLNANYRALSWLSIDASASYDRGYRDRVNQPGALMNAVNEGDRQYVYRNGITDSVAFGLFQGGATANKSLGKLLARFTARGETSRDAFQHVQFLSNKSFTPGASDTLKNSEFRGTTIEQRVAAALSNLNLDYAGRYILDVAVRREAIGRKKKLWQTDVRGSAAWLLNQESWLPFERLDLLKLRVSSGTSEKPSAQTSYFVPIGSPFPPDALPHIVSEYEAGFDLIAKGRLRLSATYSSMHAREDLPGSSPIVSGYELYGFPSGLKGHTIEASIGTSILKNPNGLQWDIAFVGDNRELTISQLQRTCFTDLLQRQCLDSKQGEMFGHYLIRDKSELRSNLSGAASSFDINDEGYVVAVGAGNTYRDGVAKNLWGTNVTINGRTFPWGLPITRTDENGLQVEKKIGDGNPTMRYGVQNTFRYKSFRLYGQFTGTLGGDVYNNYKQSLYAQGLHTDLDQTGKPAELKKTAAYYRAVANDNNDYLENFVEKGSYARLSEASAGIAFNASRFGFVRRIGAERVDLDLIGRNLFTITNYSGNNPQTGAYGLYVDNVRFPLTRTFTFATSVVF